MYPEEMEPLVFWRRLGMTFLCLFCFLLGGCIGCGLGEDSVRHEASSVGAGHWEPIIEGDRVVQRWKWGAK